MLYRRYRHPARGHRPVQAAVRPGISCHSAARRAHRRGARLYQQLGLRGLARREPLRCFTAGAAIRAQASVNEITLVANSLPLSLGCFQWAGGGYA
jgi:hypothetical protein